MFTGTMRFSLMARTHRKEKLGRRSNSDRWITHSEFPMAVRFEFKQEESANEGKISSIRSERGDQPSSDLGEPTRSLKFNMKQAYKVPKVGGPSIFKKDTCRAIGILLTGKLKEGSSLSFQLAIRSGPSDLELI